MFVVDGCSGPLPNAVPLPLARSSPPVSHHLLHLPEIQSGMENPHPQPIYTSSLTSPQVGVIEFYAICCSNRGSQLLACRHDRAGVDLSDQEEMRHGRPTLGGSLGHQPSDGSQF